MSQAKSLSRVSQKNNISLELAISRVLNASVEEISEVLKEVPPEKTGKLAISRSEALRDRHWSDVAGKI